MVSAMGVRAGKVIVMTVAEVGSVTDEEDEVINEEEMMDMSPRDNDDDENDFSDEIDQSPNAARLGRHIPIPQMTTFSMAICKLKKIMISSKFHRTCRSTQT